jgi:hypothetical protein
MNEDQGTNYSSAIEGKITASLWRKEAFVATSGRSTV